ncbi:hypothetical protein D3C72_671120 [compost metagenome]
MGALDGQHRQLGTLAKLHVETVEMRLHPGHVLIAGGGVDHQAITLIETVDDHVVDNPALLVEHGAVQRTAGAVQAFDIIGQQMPEPGFCLGATDIDYGHVGYIEDTAIAAHLMVFLDLRSIMQRHVPTAKIDHLRAKGEMKVIQRRTLSHGFLLPGVAKVRTSAAQLEPFELKAFSRFQPLGLSDGPHRMPRIVAARCRTDT